MKISMHVKHKSLIFVMEKKTSEQLNTRTRCEICSKITIKTRKLYLFSCL